MSRLVEFGLLFVLIPHLHRSTESEVSSFLNVSYKDAFQLTFTCSLTCSARAKPLWQILTDFEICENCILRGDRKGEYMIQVSRYFLRTAWGTTSPGCINYYACSCMCTCIQVCVFLNLHHPSFLLTTYLFSSPFGSPWTLSRLIQFTKF